MAYIDESISVDENERAVIEKYGFEVRDQAGQYCLVDPLVMKTHGISSSRHIGSNLNDLLVEAVRQRKLFLPNNEASVTVITDSETEKAPENVEVSPNGVAHNPETLAVTKPKAKKPSKPRKTKSDSTNPHVATTAAKQPEPEPTSPKAEEEPTGPPSSEISDVELDNTGKRPEKARNREITKKEKKETRYTRAAKIIADDLATYAGGNSDRGTTEQRKTLARLAKFKTEGTAGHCLEAWNSITKILMDKGWLNFPPKQE